MQKGEHAVHNTIPGLPDRALQNLRSRHALLIPEYLEQAAFIRDKRHKAA